MIGQDHGLATAHFSVQSGCDPPESQQIINFTQCSRLFPFPKDTEVSQSWGFWVGSGFMKKQQLLQQQGDPRSWEKQETSKASLMLCLKPMSLQGIYACSATNEFWLHLIYGLWSQISKEARIFLSGVERQTDTQLPFLQSTHKVRKTTSIMLATFSSFSAAFIKNLTAWSNCCIISKAHFQLIPWLVFSTDRPPFLNGDCVCWQTPGKQDTELQTNSPTGVDSIWSVHFVIWRQQHRG